MSGRLILIISVDRHSIVENVVGRMDGPSVGNAVKTTSP